MASLLIHDSFECYYAGRKAGFRAKAAPKLVVSPEKRDAIPRERMLVQPGHLKTIRRLKPS
jgi:hypothetical protein